MRTNRWIFLKDDIYFDKPSFHYGYSVSSSSFLWTLLGWIYIEEWLFLDFLKLGTTDYSLQMNVAGSATHIVCAPSALLLDYIVRKIRCLKQQKNSHIEKALYINDSEAL